MADVAGAEVTRLTPSGGAVAGVRVESLESAMGRITNHDSP